MSEIEKCLSSLPEDWRQHPVWTPMLREILWLDEKIWVVNYTDWTTSDGAVPICIGVYRMEIDALKRLFNYLIEAERIFRHVNPNSYHYEEYDADIHGDEYDKFHHYMKRISSPDLSLADMQEICKRSIAKYEDSYYMDTKYGWDYTVTEMSINWGSYVLPIHR